MIVEFHWKAINRFGQKQRGKCLAQSREALEKTLLNKGYSSLKISRNFVLPTAPKAEQVTQLLSQLALLLNAAIPFKMALTMLIENCQHIRLYQWLQALNNNIERGFAFSEALGETTPYLSPQEIQLIQMGEASGQLAMILTKLVETRTKAETLRKKVKKSAVLPAFCAVYCYICCLSTINFLLCHSLQSCIPLKINSYR